MHKARSVSQLKTSSAANPRATNRFSSLNFEGQGANNEKKTSEGDTMLQDGCYIYGFFPREQRR